MEECDKKQEERKYTPSTGLQTGFTELDQLTGGLQPSELIVVACEPNVSTNAFILNLVANVGVEARLPVAIYSHVMKREEFVLNLLSATSGLHMSRIRNGFLCREDWPLLSRAAGRLGESPIFINDSLQGTVAEIREEVLRLKSESNLALVIIDNLKFVRLGEYSVKHQASGEILHCLKSLAEEVKTPVVVISETQGLTSSGAFGVRSDVALFIFREKFGQGDSRWPCGCINVSVLKQDGSLKTVRIAFHRGYHAIQESAWGTPMNKSTSLKDCVRDCFGRIEWSCENIWRNL